MAFSFKVIEKLAEGASEWAELKKLVHSMKDGKAYVKAGVVGEAAAEIHADGASNVDVAVYNEFGTDRIPARSFIRAPFDANRQKYLAALRELLPKVLKSISVQKALNLVGTAMAADMKKAIISGAGIPPPNAPSTITAKGSSRPLVDTGQLVRSISHAVVLPGEGE